MRLGTCVLWKGIWWQWALAPHCAGWVRPVRGSSLSVHFGVCNAMPMYNAYHGDRGLRRNGVWVTDRPGTFDGRERRWAGTGYIDSVKGLRRVAWVCGVLVATGRYIDSGCGQDIKRSRDKVLTNGTFGRFNGLPAVLVQESNLRPLLPEPWGRI